MKQLPEKLRNKIAWETFVEKVMRRKFSANLGICAEEAGLEKEYPSFMEIVHKEMVKRGGRFSEDYHYPELNISVAERNEIAWILLIAAEYIEGSIKIDPKFRENAVIYNVHTRISVSDRDYTTFIHEVVLAVVHKAFEV